MKRSELKVGDELYHARPHEWKNDRDGDHVTVLAVEPYKNTASEWSVPNFTKVESGPGVLVTLRRSYAVAPRKAIVQLGHLRGPYAQIKAEVEKRQAERRAERDRAADARNSERAEANQAVHRLTQAGFQAHWEVDRVGYYVRMSTATLNKLLDAIQAGKEGL